jgi:hypothetical protein
MGTDFMIKRRVPRPGPAIIAELQHLFERVETLEKLVETLTLTSGKLVDITTSIKLGLPDHLRRTYTIITSMGQCTANQVSAKTGRARAVESHYLNVLTTMGWLTKERIGRDAIFDLAEVDLTPTIISER